VIRETGKTAVVKHPAPYNVESTPGMRRTRILLIASLLAGSTACGAAGSRAGHAPPLIQPGAPGQPSRTIDVHEATAPPSTPFTAADVHFMQGMIGHHAQAIDMVNLLKTRTARGDMKLLGRRIELSQSDEIQLMEGWLRARGQPLPSGHVHALMPGMLTAEQMDRLAHAAGAEFDRLFLEGMIHHHDGALAMVQELFDTPGGGEEPEIFTFASDVDADQRAEIARMAAMLAELQQ
jgi:uncharacterized protein (DUF305 family)